MDTYKQGVPPEETKVTNAYARNKRTTVIVPGYVRKWLVVHEMRLSSLVRAAPEWHNRAISAENENKELLNNLDKAKKMLARLMEENMDLMRFKEKTRKQMKEKSLFASVDE